MPGTTPSTEHKDHVVLGMMAAVAAFLMFTIMNVIAKLLAVRHSVVEIAFYRNLIAILPFLALIYGFGRREILTIRAKPLWVVLRAILGTVSLATTFYAYSLLPMAETTAFLFTASLYIPVLGIVFLKEHVGKFRWAALLAGFVGVLVMLRPTGELSVLGVGVAIGAAMLHAIMQIVLRFIGRYERPESVTFYFFLIGLIVSAVPLPFLAVKPTLGEIPLLLGVGLSGAAAQFLLSTALSNAPAAIVTVFNYSGIVWATLFGWLIWGDWPMPTVLTGAAIVITANLLIIWRESRIRNLTGSRLRAKL